MAHYGTLMSVLMLGFCISCHSQKTGKLNIVETSKGFSRSYLYHDDKLFTLMSDTDSFVYKYNKKDDIEAIYQYKARKGKGEVIGSAKYSYANGRIQDVSYSQDFNVSGSICQTSLVVENPNNLLCSDLKYLETIFKKGNINNKHLITQHYVFNIEVGQLQGTSISPFLYGTTLKDLRIVVEQGKLKMFSAIFFDEPSKQDIKYIRKYSYNSDGSLSSLSSINETTNEVEDSSVFTYVKQ